MAYDVNKLTTVGQMKTAMSGAEERYAKQSDVNSLKNKVENLVTAGGEPNTIDQIKVNGVVQTPVSKVVNITVPTAVSSLTNDKQYQTKDEVAAAVAAADHLKRKIVANENEIDLDAEDADQYIYMIPKNNGTAPDKYYEWMIIDGVPEQVGNWEVDLSGYVKKETGKGLSTNDFTTVLLEKLNGIEAGANKYTHPAYTANALGLWKVQTDATGHVVSASKVTKADITALGIPGQDTTYSEASASAAGLMSAADKTKLAGLNIATDSEVQEMLLGVFA